MRTFILRLAAIRVGFTFHASAQTPSPAPGGMEGGAHGITWPDAAVWVALHGLPPGVTTARLQRFQIDQDHGNAFAAWKQMGSPRQPGPEQYARLEKAGRLQATGAPETIHPVNGEASIAFTLPRQAVPLLAVTW